jgi:cardiolipin synthase
MFDSNADTHRHDRGGRKDNDLKDKDLVLSGAERLTQPRAQRTSQGLCVSALAVLIVLGGCGPLAQTGRTPKRPQKPAVSTTMTAAVYQRQGALEAVEAVRSGNTLWVRFALRSKDSDYERFVYARAVLDFQYAPGEEGASRFDVPLEWVDAATWARRVKDRPQDRTELVRFLDAEHWPRIKQRLAAELLESTPGTGVTVPLEGEAFVFYYDEDGQAQFKPKDQKPQQVQIVKGYDALAVQQIFFNTIRQYVRVLGIPSGQSNQDIDDKSDAKGETIASEALADPQSDSGVPQVRFVEGEHPSSDANGLWLLAVTPETPAVAPFVYLDLKQQVLASLRFPPPDKDESSPAAASLWRKGWKTADALVLESHVFGVVSRPFSSVLRLFYWSRNTAFDTAFGLIDPQKVTALASGKIPPAAPDRPFMDQEAFARTLDRVVGDNRSSGTMRVWIGGDAFFPRLVTALGEARESIEVRIFIFDNDDYAVKIADILKAQSRQGVKVKVLLDSMGQVMGEGRMPEGLPPGFEPPASMARYLKEDSKVDVRVTPSSMLKADHVKTITIDGQVAFTGGMNIGREYRYDWHDLMVELQGPVVNIIRKDFDLAWANAGPWGDFEYMFKRLFSRAPDTQQQGDYPIRPLYTRLNAPQIYQAQLQAIRHARHHIYVHNAYFSDDTILRELIKARKRGVDVRVILPVASNHGIMNANNVVVANQMFNNGIKVYFYPGMSHVKAAIYDGWLCTGSANFDRLSFWDNKEFNVATAHPATVATVKTRLFEKDFAKSRIMTEPLDNAWKNYLAEILAEQL